jgi:hypothetical protein
MNESIKSEPRTPTTKEKTEGRTIMTAEEKIALNERNIRQAIKDYGRYTYDQDVLEDVSDEFIETVAYDNYYAKQELRELFRKSPAWNEELDAIVINGTRTHDPDYNRVWDIAYAILRPNMRDDTYRTIHRAISFFSDPEACKEDRTIYLDALKQLAPNAYAPGKKLSRVFRDLCKAVGVADETKGSAFQKLYAQFADELQAKQIQYKLFVSINPAHWITMSNPKKDSRGTTLTSCHSFNSTDYSYNNGCSGYARDKYSFICFTVDDPTIPELLNNRKTTRQIFVYQPGSGLLLQSRMYDSQGGTSGVQPLSKDYRDLIQRELSDLENATNLWTTKKYLEQNGYHFYRHDDFGGYPDWEYSDFVPMVSVRVDADDPEGVTIGEAGVCIKCGDYTSNGVYCEDCENSGIECAECGYHFDEDEMTLVYNSYGDHIQVCPCCLDRHYTMCADCEEYFPNDSMTEVAGGDYVCETCLENYVSCDHCGEYDMPENMEVAVDSCGDEVYVCSWCADHYCSTCDDCGRLVYDSDATVAHDAEGHERVVCPSCLDDYERCDSCGEYYKEVDGGVCPDCREEREAS